MNDLISRQAAIKAICEDGTMLERQGKYTMTMAERKQKDADILDSLPSSQPGWIPCSERLPEESGRYLISVLDGVGRRTTVAPYRPRCKAWTMTGRMVYWKVVAWMPLPEPWRGEKDD